MMSKLLPIIINPNPILRKESSAVKVKKISTTKFQELCADMIKTMTAKDGVGLAAPQIGKNIRLIAVNTMDGPMAMVNPKILKKSWTKEWSDEGCLSVPDVFGKVRRHKKIQCFYIDKNNRRVNLKASGLLARVIQHEIDHLDGILFIDKIKDMKNYKTVKA